MTQFEVRTKDLKTVILILRNQDTVREDPKQWFQWVFSMASGVVLVEHEFETPAEADAARLNWLQYHPHMHLETLHDSDGTFFRIYKPFSDLFTSIRDCIDAARRAPQPTVRVIATPDGPVDPT